MLWMLGSSHNKKYSKEYCSLSYTSTQQRHNTHHVAEEMPPNTDRKLVEMNGKKHANGSVREAIRKSKEKFQKKRRYTASERTNMSFFLVVIFLVIFATIIGVELLLMNAKHSITMTDVVEFTDGDKDWQAESQRRIARELAKEADTKYNDNVVLLVNENIGSTAGVNLNPQPQANHQQIVQELNTETTDWQTVSNTKDKFYVYSAYYDNRRGRFIRVLAATKTRGSEKVFCRYWYTSDQAVTVPAINKVIRENWNLKYSAYFILCPLLLFNMGKVINVPNEVSITLNPHDKEVSNRLRVMNADESRRSPIVDGLAVCVKPLHYNFNRALQLIEFIELNRLLGVEHFTFYNHTIGNDVSCILNEYTHEGVVSLLPWHLNMTSQKEIRTEGLFAALNDCIYRNMYRYKFLLMIDLDEYIVPHLNNTLTDMVSYILQKVDGNRAGSFSFMNAFFYLQWPNDPNSQGLLPLVTLQKTHRRAKFHPHKQRSKCIVIPEFVTEMGNHFVWEFVPGKATVNVPPEAGFLHHYRVCEFGGDDCVKTPWLADRTIYKYKADLVSRVLDKLEDSKRICGAKNYPNPD